MATFKDLLAAQTKSAESILAFIKSETLEILAQLEKGKAEAADAATSAAFDEAIGSLGDFTAKIGEAVQGMVPGMVTPAPEKPVDAPAEVVEVKEAEGAVEVPVVITETSTGVEGSLSVEVTTEATVG